MDGGPAPAGMKAATNAKYPVGTKVTLAADHMPGMNGASATAVGVYSTTEPVYMVDYTAGGMTMKNHKWVVESEIKPAG